MARSIWSRRDQERDLFLNDGTVVPSSLGGPFRAMSGAPSFSEVFCEHYDRIRGLLNAHTEPGLALFVASDEGLEAAAWWEAPERDINPLIVGRHSAAEVFIPSSPSLSLRHLALIIHPRRAGDGVRFRVFDLRTPTAFQDESGRRLEAVEADGPLMLRFASLTALLFPTGGSEEPWPESPDAGWRRVPERVHLECATAHPERWLDLAGRRPLRAPEDFDASGGPPTLSTSFPGPAFVGRNMAGTDCVRGELVVRCGGKRVSLRLGQTTMRQGVLLGRYDRCDNGGVAVLNDESLSRVHLLLLETARGFYAVDTASKNGVWQGRRRVSVARVEPGPGLSLASVASVEWRPIH